MARELYVELTGSDNTYLQYPCIGLLELFEIGNDGGILIGVFRRITLNEGKLTGGPVEVRNPVFYYRGGMPQNVRAAVAEQRRGNRVYLQFPKWEEFEVDGKRGVRRLVSYMERQSDMRYVPVPDFNAATECLIHYASEYRYAVGLLARNG